MLADLKRDFENEGGIVAPLKILFLASEVDPLAKTGGLADVAGALPIALHELGCDIRIATPFYRHIKEGNFDIELFMKGITVQVGRLRLTDDVYCTYLNKKVPVYLFNKEEFYDRNQLYGTHNGDYFDNVERFVYLSKGALEFCLKSEFIPDIIHCNDWHAALVPVYLKTLYKEEPLFKRTASVLTIHNLAYQGIYPPDEYSVTGLPNELYTPEGIEFWGNINFLKGGILFADAITTVSKRYSHEIQSPEFGFGLDDILRNRRADLYGILNGVKYSVWDPSVDPFIAKKYDVSHLSGKKACKKDLVNALHMDPSYMNKPILAVISRLTEQKGCDLLGEIVNELMRMDVGFVLLGEGERKYNKMFGAVRREHIGKAGIIIGYNNQLAHKIMAGADIFLMPSRYEPCGLTQMYALRYGAVPIVRDTGGLSDTIQEFVPETGKGTGFKFLDYSASSFMEEIKNALQLFENKNMWTRIVKNGMKADFSWKRSAQKYLEVYKKASATTSLA